MKTVFYFLAVPVCLLAAQLSAIADPLQISTQELKDEAHLSMAVVNGNPAVAYYAYDDTVGVGALTFIRAKDVDGTEWHAPVVLDSGGSPSETGKHPSLAVVDGNPAVSYYDLSNGTLKYVRADDADGTAWGGPVVVDDAGGGGDSDGGVGEWSCLAVVNGNPAISYFDVRNSTLKYIRAADAQGSAWAAAVDADVTFGVGFYTCLAVVDGNPAIAYYDAMNQSLLYVRASDEDGDFWGWPETVDNAVGNHGIYFTRPLCLSVVNGNPAVAYYDISNRILKFVRAENQDGADWSTAVPVVVDASADVGDFCSLAVVEGNPSISYYDRTNSTLKFTGATDVDGAAWSSPVVPDNTAGAGMDTFLLVVNGNPAVAYFQLNNPAPAVKGIVKYARAADAKGASWTPPASDDGGDTGGADTGDSTDSGGSQDAGAGDSGGGDTGQDTGCTTLYQNLDLKGSGINGCVMVKPDVVVRNGYLGGVITNDGTLEDIEILANSTVTGGTLSGGIASSGTILGDIILKPGTVVDGGTIKGNITGGCGALITNALIDAATLSKVVLAQGTTLTTDCAKGSPGLNLMGILTDTAGKVHTDVPLVQDDNGNEKSVNDLVADAMQTLVAGSPTVTGEENGCIIVSGGGMGNAKAAATLLSVRTTDRFDTVRLTSTGEVYIVSSRVALTLAPAAADLSEFTAALAKAGISGDVGDDGLVLTQLPGGTLLVLRFDSVTQGGGTLPTAAQAGAFSLTGDPSLPETLMIRVTYPNGTIQNLPPFIHHPNKFKSAVQALGNVDFTIEPSSGLIVLTNESKAVIWQGIPGYSLVPLPDGTALIFDMYFEPAGDVNADGIDDFYAVSSAGRQVLFTLK